MYRLLLILTVACASESEPEDVFGTSDFDAPEADTGDFARRGVARPPRRLDTPTSGNSQDDEAPCSAGESWWVRVSCLDAHYEGGTAGWVPYRGEEGEWVCPRCYIDYCATPQWSEYHQEEIYPSLIQLPECRPNQIPATRPHRPPTN